MSKTKLKKAKPAARRVPKVLSDPLYCYVEPGNGAHARVEGKKLFGSFSSYVNALIAKDRGVTPHLGEWKAKGEAKKLRKEKKSAGKKLKKTPKKKSASSRKSTSKKAPLK